MRLNYILVVIYALTSGCAARLSTPEASALSSNQGSSDGSDPVLPDLKPEVFNLKKESDLYRQRYGLTDPHAKLVNNRGDLYEDLYGVRNFRVVLHGVYYRGGANNLYNKNEPRANTNPLPVEGLKNLCHEGFKNSIYLYSDNFSTAPSSTSCKDYTNTPRTLNYMQISGLKSGNEEKFISMIYKRIKGEIDGPIYGHCWNGWHASGYVAAVTLKQFCGYSDQKALDYWIKNTDGDSNYDTIKQKIKAWKPIDKYKITGAESAAICP